MVLGRSTLSVNILSFSSSDVTSFFISFWSNLKTHLIRSRQTGQSLIRSVHSEQVHRCLQGKSTTSDVVFIQTLQGIPWVCIATLPTSGPLWSKTEFLATDNDTASVDVCSVDSASVAVAVGISNGIRNFGQRPGSGNAVVVAVDVAEGEAFDIAAGAGVDVATTNVDDVDVGIGVDVSVAVVST